MPGTNCRVCHLICPCRVERNNTAYQIPSPTERDDALLYRKSTNCLVCWAPTV
ncbi:C2H2-type domain-containing protein [Psidium guajava]|nr:C2H2-type domain-containing protein [Psidium guajava]